MTRKELKQAINEITEDTLLTGEKEALETIIWNAIEERTEKKYAKAHATIDFLHMAGRIELTDAFKLADLIG